MAKIEARTPKGFRDFLGSDARRRQNLITSLTSVFERFGFEPLLTPALEYAEVLKGKYGEEEKLIYEFEDRGGRRVAMRYDQTVPLARVIANYPQIIKPYKRYQIQPVWRAENPQKGRYREFLQVDIDTIGSTSLLADAEIIALIVSAMEELGFKNFTVKINDREVFAGLPTSAIAAIDKLDKVGEEGVLSLLRAQGFSDYQSKDIFNKVVNSKPTATINKLFDILEKMKVNKSAYSFDPSLARGLDYYTSTIFELEVDGYTAGSLGGGGRYDKLIGLFTENNLPAVGFAFGFDRLVEAMETLNKEDSSPVSTKVLVTMFNEELIDNSLQTVAALRKLGIAAEVYLDSETKLDKQIKYADQKRIPFVVIIGPEEAKNEQLTVKNLNTGEQQTVKLSGVKALIDRSRS